MGDDTGLMYFLSNGETDSVRQNLSTILQKLSADSVVSASRPPPVVISSKRHLINVNGIQGFLQYFISLCRGHNLLKNDRVTVLSTTDQLIVLQLCLAERNKQEKGDFDVETSVVLQADKDIVNKKLNCHVLDTDISSAEESGIETDYKNFLKNCNCLDFCDIYNILKREFEKNVELQKEINNQTFVFLDNPKSKSEKTMLEFLCTNKVIKSVSIEVPLDIEQEITVTIGDSCLATILDTTLPLSTVKKSVSVTEAYVRLVYLSYLELLINSRSELALARVINVPERDLTHKAFTELKHEAKEKNMTMYQTAMSYVMKLRLGGKGYAPDPNCPLGQHIKGLSEFVTLMQRMEEVLEEDQDIRSACSRVVKVIRKEMIKCRDSKLRPSSVEAVASHLQEQITSIIDMLDQQIVNTPDRPACNGGSLTSRRARKALRHLLDKLATVDDEMSSLDHLTDIYSSQRTPIRFPSVMSQFRSPEEELEVTSPDNRYNKSLSERMMNRQDKAQTPVHAKRYKSDHDWAAPVHDANLTKEQDIFSLSQVYVIPSKTIVHAGSKFSSGEANRVLESMLDQENITDSTGPSCRPATSNVMSNQRSNINNNISIATKKTSKEIKVRKEKGTKRPLEEESSSQGQKKQKGEKNKTCRRKLLPQVKGQQQLTKFFRV